MKFKHLLQLALMALPAIAFAVPAPQGLLTVKNPDGSTVQVRAYGDEKFCYYTDADGKFLLERDSRGYWTQAVRQGRNLNVNQADIDVLYAESPAAMLAQEMIPYGGRSQQRMAALDSEGRTTYTTEGEVPALVVLVDFKDTKFSIPDIRNQIDKYCNQEGYSDYKSQGSARDYFIHQSGGKFKPHFEVVGPITASENATYYGKNANDHRMLGYLIREVLQALDNEVDFSRFDLDGDQLIDNIYFIYAGHSAADTGNYDYIWPHQGNYYNFQYYEKLPELWLDGVRMGPYAISNELKGDTRLPVGAVSPWLDGIGNFVHEYGHVLGLPDLYDAYKQGPETVTPGEYDVMSQGSYNKYATCPPGYSGYEKWLCRWIEYEDLVDATEYDVPAHSDGSNQVVYRSRVPRAGTTKYTGEYFIFESRSNTAWDSSLPEHGIYIWKIDYDRTYWVANKVNTDGYARVQMMPSNTVGATVNTWPYTTISGEVINASYPGFHPLDPHAFSPNFKLFLTGITYDDQTGMGHFQHNMITSLPTHTTTACIPTKFNSGYDLHLSWRPCDEAESYAVTLKRIDPNTLTERYVDGLNDKNVGNVTELRVRNLTAATFKQNFEFFVRTVSLIPSSKTSNTVKFTTDDLLIYDPEDPYNEKAENGVNEINAENAAIFGGAGCIIAPEGAKVYTIGGAECGKANLDKGVYLVRYGNKTVKVVVK